MSKLGAYKVHVLVILLVAAIGSAGYFYNQLRELRKTPDAVAQADLKETVARVSRLIRLPDGETPVLATVSDPEKLKDQPFFAKARAGDKVLVYSKAQKAYLYDPEADILIDVGTTTVQDQSATKTTDQPTSSTSNGSANKNTPKPAPSPVKK